MTLRERYCIILLAVLFFLLSINLSLSQAATPEKEHKLELSLGTGYFFPIREGFREYYGSDFLYEIGATYRISSLFRVGIDVSYTHLKKSEYPVKFTMLSFVPSIKVVLPIVPQIEFYLGAGPGYYKANVKLNSGAVKGEFAKGGIGLKGYGGFKYYLSERIFLIIEGVYNHTFLGEPKEAGYGNVGGLSGMVKLGMSL